MQFWFWIFLVLVLIIVVSILMLKNSKKAHDEWEVGDKYDRGSEPKAWIVLRLVVPILGIVASLCLIMSSFEVIPVRSVGIQVTLGKPSGSPLKNGLHGIAPWSKVDTCDASLKTLSLTNAKNGDDGDSGDPVSVRIGNATIASVEVNTQWNINPNGNVTDLYMKYKGCDKIEEKLVRPKLQHALNNAFGRYDPLSSINGTADAPVSTVDELGETARKALQSDVGTGIEITTITIIQVHYDGPTEDRLKAYQAALADTRIANQQKLTNEAIKAANDILVGSTSSKDPGVQFQNCLNMLKYLADKDQLKNLAATNLQCVVGANGTPVIVTTK